MKGIEQMQNAKRTLERQIKKQGVSYLPFYVHGLWRKIAGRAGGARHGG